MSRSVVGSSPGMTQIRVPIPGDMPNPAVAADAEQRVREELATMPDRFRGAARAILPGVAVAGALGGAWLIRRRWRRG
jgi:hypothetical protein